MSLFPHVDEVADDDSTDIAQPYLTRDLVCGTQVDLIGRFFCIVVNPAVATVNVDRDECFSLVDYDRPAALQWQIDS
jgi:hypothetical protein